MCYTSSIFSVSCTSSYTSFFIYCFFSINLLISSFTKTIYSLSLCSKAYSFEVNSYSIMSLFFCSLSSFFPSCSIWKLTCSFINWRFFRIFSFFANNFFFSDFNFNIEILSVCTCWETFSWGLLACFSSSWFSKVISFNA